uniref:Uncharacterized protein n=1 Tax=Romanomermis culicivorax TaxID=13658 RepID=A0A915ILX7_ROMCU
MEMIYLSCVADKHQSDQVLSVVLTCCYLLHQSVLFDGLKERKRKFLENVSLGYLRLDQEGCLLPLICIYMV